MFRLFLFKDMKLAENEAQLLLGSADEDRSGGIDMREFLSIMTTSINQLDLEEELRGTFNVFDKDGNGTINANELKRFVRVSLKKNKIKIILNYYFSYGIMIELKMKLMI